MKKELKAEWCEKLRISEVQITVSKSDSMDEEADPFFFLLN